MKSAKILVSALFVMSGCAAQSLPPNAGSDPTDGTVGPQPATPVDATPANANTATSRAVVSWGATGHQSTVHLIEFRKAPSGWQSRIRTMQDFDGGMAKPEGASSPEPYQEHACSAWQAASPSAVSMLDDDAMWMDQRGTVEPLNAHDTGSWPSAECWKEPFTRLCEAEADYDAEQNPPGPSTAARTMADCADDAD